jgi:hypothetical protein
MCVVGILAIVLCAAWGANVNACDKTPTPAPAPCAGHQHQVQVGNVICPPVPCCCEDARICIIEEVPPVCYTEAGLQAFVAIFRGAAAKGVENATVRAFNATKVVPDCIDCDKDKPKK